MPYLQGFQRVLKNKKPSIITEYSGISVGLITCSLMSHNKSMSKKKIAKELKDRYGEKAVLFAEHLSDLIGSDHRVVKCLRAGLSIPLPTVKVGQRWGIKLNDVAEWMALRETSSDSKQSTILANNRLQSPARQRASIGRSLLGLKTQIESLQVQLDYLKELYSETLILEYLASQKLEDKLELPYPRKIRTRTTRRIEQTGSN
jgi:hypothetical protein